MKVNLTIDGRQVAVDAQATVLEAAKTIGIEIPTFCYHPRLEVFGGCRMCLVEVEGWRKLETACTCKVSEGMIVHTDTPKVQAGRKAMLEFLLVNHPLDCPVCDRSGACDLQDLVFKYGSAETRFKGQKRVLPDRVVSPLIDRNVNRCIQCKRCVRACDEIQGVAALGMAHRGAKTVVVPFMDKTLDCEFCGHCIYVCPVGCVTPMPARHVARTWEMEKTPSVCSYCSNGCRLEYNSRDEKVLKVSHLEGPGVNNASLCSKGFFGYDAINHPDRITTPLIRKNGQLTESSWEEALETVAEKLGQFSGGQAGGIASPRMTNEDLYLFQKFFRTALKSNNVDTTSGNWARKVLPVLDERLGVFASPNSVGELSGAGAILIVGCDITVSAPITGLKIKEALRKGARVTEINPARSPLKRLGTRSLLVSPGQELAVVKGMIRVILDENLVDLSAVRSWEGFGDLEKTVREKDLDDIAGMTGVDREGIRQAARDFAGAPKASILFGEIAALQPGGEKLIHALLDLLFVTGKAGREGSGIHPVYSPANYQGAVDMGAGPSWLPGRVDKKALEKAWGTSLPEEAGLDALRMIQAASEGKLKALYLVGVDPFSSIPGSSEVQEALEKLEFLVVQDLFMTEAARNADVVLPAAGMAEREGTLTSSERRVQKISKAVRESGESRADWKIFTGLAAALKASGMDFSSPKDILGEISRVVPSYAGLGDVDLGNGGVQWPAPGTERLCGDGAPGGKERFGAVAEWSTREKGSQYPLSLILGELLFHSGSLSRYSENLNKIVSSACLLLNPQTAAEFKIPDESTVRIYSANGSVKVQARHSEDLVPGVLFLPRHFENVRASDLMVPGPGTESMTAVVKVRVERIEE